MVRFLSIEHAAAQLFGSASSNLGKTVNNMKRVVTKELDAGSVQGYRPKRLFVGKSNSPIKMYCPKLMIYRHDDGPACLVALRCAFQYFASKFLSTFPDCLIVCQ